VRLAILSWLLFEPSACFVVALPLLQQAVVQVEVSGLLLLADLCLRLLVTVRSVKAALTVTGCQVAAAALLLMYLGHRYFAVGEGSRKADYVAGMPEQYTAHAWMTVFV
jgi:hypothetical protein